jgi:glycosyltransferase involved in cell wall biosynthesis
MNTLSIVVPVYFNEKSLRILYERFLLLTKHIKDTEFEFFFVDDGSQDDSFKVLERIAAKDERVKIIKLSRNFGSFVACLAGLKYCAGDCAVIISADLQDPPELIEELYEEWLKGFEVVLAVRRKREESFAKVLFANMYYRLVRYLAIPDMPKGGFDFVLIDRKVIDIITKINEKNTTLMGLILWTGFSRSIVNYDKMKRKHGASMWTLGKKLKYFVDTFVAFSFAPLRFMSIVGIMLSLLGFFYAAFLIFYRLVYGTPIEGWTTLMVVILITSGVQLFSFGIIGEYLWRNFDETRKRPIYIIDKVVGVNPSSDAREKKKKLEKHKIG